MNILLSKKTLNLLDFPFSDIAPVDFSNAFDFLIPLAEKEFEELLILPSTFYNLFHKYESEELLSSIFNILNSLNMLDKNEEYKKVQEKYSSKIITLSQNNLTDIRFFNKLLELKNSEEFSLLDSNKQMFVLDYIKDIQLLGVNLPSDKKEELVNCMTELNLLVQKFESNITETEELLGFYAPKDSLHGLPQRCIDTAKEIAKQNGVNGYYFDIVSGLYDDILQYSETEELRKKVYNDLLLIGKHPKYDNTSIINNIFIYNQKIAKTLGYNNYAEYSTSEKMSKNPENVKKFIQDLGLKSIPSAKSDFDKMSQFGCDLLNKNELNFWDIQFVQNKFKEHLFKTNEEEIRNYFPINHVVEKTFEFMSNLFDVKIEKTLHNKLWRSDVEYYTIKDLNDVPIATFFLDLYSQEGKMPGAWVAPMVTRNYDEYEQINPVSFLVCNNAKSIDSNRPSTFTFEELFIFYHELGHLLHNSLTKVNISYYSGFNNVYHDAIEFPSQLLENFVYQYDLIKFISKNINTNDALPLELFNKIYESKNFMASNIVLNMVRYSDIDISLYSQDLIDCKSPIEIENEIKLKWKCHPLVDVNNLRTPKFNHIFGGGYEAGYYGYQWAEVLSLHAFHYFKKSFNNYSELKNLALKYKKEVLETGGLIPMEKNFFNIFNEEPSIVYYLKEYGIN